MEEFRHYYVLNCKLTTDEDSTHEFKGHRIISHADLKLDAKSKKAFEFNRTRQAVSRCFCAFLNSGNGGDIYLGVNDDGRVISLRLSLKQMDHVLLQIARVFDDFSPPVPSHLWWISFIPVVNSKLEVRERLELIQDWRSIRLKDIKRLVPHKFPSNGDCWCDAIQNTEKQHGYVIRIHLKQTKKNFMSLNDDKFRLTTIYQCDDGNAYFRNSASVIRYSPQQVIRHAQEEVSNHYQPIVDNLKKELAALLH